MKPITRGGIALLLFMLCSVHFMNSQERGVPVKQETITRRVAGLIKVRPEYEERYIILHKHVFPEVLARIHKSNIRNYSIFLKNGMLFSYYEYVGNDYDTDMKAIGDTVTKEWWKLTDPMQEPLPNRKGGEWWASMETMFEAHTAETPATEVQRFAFVDNVHPDSIGTFRTFFKNEQKALLTFMNTVHLRTLETFYRDGCFYTYVEYSGTDWKRDKDAVADTPEASGLAKRWEKLLRGPGSEEMTMVFHTN